MSNLLDKYIYQALDAYPNYLEETIEALNYALSYDDKNPIALSLMGQIHAEKLRDYEGAKKYYQQALSEDLYCLDVYPKYIQVLLLNEDLNEAEKLIEFALTIKGINKALILLKKAILFERKGKYKKALSLVKLSKQYNYDNSFLELIESDKKRIKDKIPKKKTKELDKKDE